MNFLYNLKIRVKLLSGFILVALIAGIIGITGSVSMKRINSKGIELYELNTVPLENISRAAISFQRIRVNLKQLLIDKDVKDKEKHCREIADLDKLLNENLDKYEKSIKTDAGKDEVRVLRGLLDSYLPLREKGIQLIMENKNEEALAVFAQATPIADKVDSSITRLVDLKTTSAKEKCDDNTIIANRSTTTILILSLIGCVLAVVIGWIIANMINNPIKKLVRASEKIANGDLDVHIDIYTKDEVGALAASFRNMADHINEVMSNINASSQQVAGAASQVSQASMGLSQGATEQASALEELTSSVEEISAQTKQNAINAEEANKLSIITSENANKGNMRMGEMLEAMGEINQSSSSIYKIIKVIDEIAFQTNILALNAAVEAARAGQHGKGFAVVADEVRNLAARSANAAKETAVLIEGSIKKVETGTSIANETAEALNEILENVNKSKSLIGDIASASSEQAVAVEQINEGITQVSNVVQTNSATAQESAAASEELSNQAYILKDMVERFKLKKDIDKYSNYGNLSSDVIKMLQNMAENKGYSDAHSSLTEAAASKSKIKISLGDKD